MMKRVVFIVFLYASVSAVSEEAQKIGAKLAAMKAKTHQSLTAAKDVTPLIERIDKDLQGLAKQKQELASLKQSLMIKKHSLQKDIAQKTGALDELQAEYIESKTHLEFQIDLLNGLNAQKSIQSEVQLVAQESSRATLLADVFALKFAPSITPSLMTWGEASTQSLFVEDVRG